MSSSHTRLPNIAVDAGADEAPEGVVDAHDSAALAALQADEAHWSDARVCGANEGLYFAKRDPRLCVRKRSRALSYRINFGHPRAFAALFALTLGVALATGVGLATMVINVVMFSRLKRC